MMGQGICYAAAMAGISVTIKDTSLEAAERGKAYTAKLLAKRVATGRLTEEAKTEILNRITATEDTKALKGCDLIIEAVFENETLKAQVLKEHEALLAEGGFWGSNTSTLPITVLAQNAANPARFIGLHFFSPVDKMPLLEIVVDAKTDEETVARALILHAKSAKRRSLLTMVPDFSPHARSVQKWKKPHRWWRKELTLSWSKT